MGDRSESYGWDHQKRRAALPAPNGEPCPRCGYPMWPGMRLDAGHSTDRAFGGHDSPLRWEHARCNRKAGAKLGARMRGRKKRTQRDWLGRWA